MLSDEVKLCEIPLLNRQSVIIMQCSQKRYDVFINLLWIFTTTLIFHVTCNFCTVIWALPMTGLRKITGIINDLQEAISTSRIT